MNQASEPEYRLARAEDVPAIADVIRDVVEGPNPVVFDRPWSVEEVSMWRRRLGNSGAIYVAVEDDTLIGFGALDYSTRQPETCTLGVWLRSEWRRRGIGTVLAEYLLSHAREQNFRRVVGSLPDNNEAALSFLSAIGALAPLINPNSRFELPL
ncbi:MAG: GNAT family N-acetyltransferase [Chloroflexi bacterium]|nr:GNAT family N-acetyltransferase [Chloroflexota bacterium]